MIVPFSFGGKTMVVTRLKIPLEQAEYSALLKVALSEMRNPSDQARFILHQELERRGLLAAQSGDSIQPATQARGIHDDAK
jgi:hypothetical protein